jgi:hypothetical protein
MANAFRGTSSAQDVRFKDKLSIAKKRIQVTAPSEYSTEIDMSKVRKEVVFKWVHDKLLELMGGVEDEVLEGMVRAVLEGKVSQEWCGSGAPDRPVHCRSLRRWSCTCSWKRCLERTLVTLCASCGRFCRMHSLSPLGSPLRCSRRSGRKCSNGRLPCPARLQRCESG